MDKLLEVAKLGDLLSGPFLGGGTRKRLSNGFALNFIGQTYIRAMHGLARLMTVTVGLAAVTAGIGYRPTAQISETSELFHEFGSPGLQILKRIGHENTPPGPSVSNTLGSRPQKKENARVAILMSHTRRAAEQPKRP